MKDPIPSFVVPGARLLVVRDYWQGREAIVCKVEPSGIIEVYVCGVGPRGMFAYNLAPLPGKAVEA